MRTDLNQLRSQNGLLYPPEIWAALSPSAASEVQRNLALKALGERITWSLPPAELHQALLQDVEPLTAAWLMTQAGLKFDVPAHQIAGWVAAEIGGVNDAEALEHLARTLAVGESFGVHPVLSERAIGDVTRMLDDPSPLLVRQALEVLLNQHRAPVDPPIMDEWLRSLETKRRAGDPVTLARELQAWVSLRAGRKPVRLDLAFWSPLIAHASSDDEVYSYLVRAAVEAGDAVAAHDIAARFDERRIMKGGGVLEPPMFDGSVGSTFRVVHFLSGEPRGIASAGHEEVGSVVKHVKELLDKDLSHRVAGLATLQLLRPGSVPVQVRRSAIEDALKAEGGQIATPLSIEGVMAWTSLAQQATVLNVPVPYPGLSDGGRAALLSADDAALYAGSELLLALKRSGHAEAPEAAVLTNHLMEALQGRAMSEVNSPLLFNGSLALLELTGRTPFPRQALEQEAEARRGGCRGGFQRFLRESRVDGSVCNVDATRQATELRTSEAAG